MTASGPLAKRPPHIALELVLSAIPPVPPRRQRLPSLAAALLYAALGVSANPAPAGEPDADAAARIEALRTGEMRKLVVHAAPVAAPDVAFTDLDGSRDTGWPTRTAGCAW